jgi:glycosyltransferase involved in cell wall biosynthesis
MGLRVGVDATPLIGPRSGVGHTTASLVDALVGADEGVEIVLLPISMHSAAGLREFGRYGTGEAGGHPRIRVVRTRLPARPLSWVWSKADWPPAELFAGSLDVFWGPNFLLPPLVRAAGVMTVHDLAFVHMPEACSDHVRSYAERVPHMAARANRIIVPSNAVAQEFSAWLPAEASRVRVVPHGVRRVFREPGGSLVPTRRRALGIRDPYALYVGNLEVRKNVELLLRAFERARSVHPDAQLVLVGAPGFGWDGIRARHAALLDSGAVVAVGYLPDPEVAALVRGAKVFVYPSRYEGFGIPPLEAMAAGTPVVAAKTPSLAEVLGEHARWVHPEDLDGLASAIADHLDGSADAATIDAAHDWAATFTWGRAARATIEVFREASGEIGGSD